MLLEKLGEFWNPETDDYSTNPSAAVDLLQLDVPRGEQLKIVVGFEGQDALGFSSILLQHSVTGAGGTWYDRMMVGEFLDTDINEGVSFALSPDKCERYIRLAFGVVHDPEVPQAHDIGVGFTEGTGLYGYIVHDAQTAS